MPNSKLTYVLAAWATIFILPFAVRGGTYQIAKDYSGSTFFDDWIFFDNTDVLTNGMVNFLSASAATDDQLAYVNDAGNIIMKVDNTSTLRLGQKRNSIRIASKNRYAIGSLWIADFVHVPYGCSTWPAFWSQAQNWPAGGEIDTFEGVNRVTRNTMSLHTTPGCVHSPNATQTSTVIETTDCSSLANSNSGCGVEDPNPSSYGEAFGQAGGGMFVTEFAESGISVWFFNRSSIPSVLQNNASSFDTLALGLPVSNWPSSGCDVDSFFQPQKLIFDITLCGDFAGEASVFQQTCPGLCYEDWVLSSPSNFDQAYFEVKSVRVFNNGTDRTIVGTGAAARIHSLSVGILGATVVILASILGVS